MAGDSLQIEQDFRFQERSWFIQRIGWMIILLTIIAALLGAFGTGPLSHTSAQDGQALVVEYERFVHYLRPTALRLRVRHNSRGEPISIKLSGAFLQGVQLNKVFPQPDKVEIGPEWTTYRFKTDAPGELFIKFDLLPDNIGSLAGLIRTEDGSQVTFAQFVFP